jgi:UDP-glucose 4-epimerase
MVLIVGAGFIGLAIYEDLVLRGKLVKVFSRSRPEIVNPSHFFQGDYKNIDQYPSMLEGVSVIVHAIHTTVPSTSFNNEIFDVESNVIPFLKLLNLCKKRDIEKFIFVSSGGAIYGASNGKEMKETDVPKPISSYGITKLTMEQYLMLNKQLFNNNVFILRPSNVFGTGQSISKPQGIIGHLINASLAKKEIQIWGDGNGLKDYIFIDDFTSAIKKIIDCPTESKTATFNVSSGKTHSIIEIVKTIETFTQQKIVLQFIEHKEFDVENISLSNLLFMSTFDWKPHNSLAQGVEKILKDKTLPIGPQHLK